MHLVLTESRMAMKQVLIAEAAVLHARPVMMASRMEERRVLIVEAQTASHVLELS
jgi:hypothetical protein